MKSLTFGLGLTCCNCLWLLWSSLGLISRLNAENLCSTWYNIMRTSKMMNNQITVTYAVIVLSKTEVLTFPCRWTILINFHWNLLFLFHSSVLIFTEIFFLNNKCVVWSFKKAGFCFYQLSWLTSWVDWWDDLLSAVPLLEQIRGLWVVCGLHTGC